jgi:hypothetical protein
MPGRRWLGVLPRLTGRAWEDAAQELEDFLRKLWASEADGVPAGWGKNTTPSPVEPGAGGNVGTGNQVGWSAADHSHPVATGVPSDLGCDNVEGTSSSVPRLDHQHKRSVRVQNDGIDVGVSSAINVVGSGLTAALDSPVATVAAVRQVGLTVDHDVVLAPGFLGFVAVPFSGTIVGWQLIADQIGSCVVDVWKADHRPSVLNSICGLEKPTLLGERTASGGISDWSGLTVEVGDIFGFYLDSVATITLLTIAVEVQETEVQSIESGLQGVWEFDELSGTRYDTKPQLCVDRYDLEEVGGTVAYDPAGCEGGGANFVTTGAYLQSEKGPLFTPAFTVEIRYKVVTPPGPGLGYVLLYQEGTQFMILVWQNRFYAEVHWGTEARASWSVDVTDGNWHHTVVWMDPTVDRYVHSITDNGADVLSPYPIGSDFALVAGNTTGSLVFGGLTTTGVVVDRTRWWNRALTAAERAGLFGGLKAYWKLDEVSGIRYDTVGDAHLTPMGTGGVGSTPGKMGLAARFDPLGKQYLHRTPQVNLCGALGITLTCWVKVRTGAPVGQVWFSLGATFVSAFGISDQNSTVLTLGLGALNDLGELSYIGTVFPGYDTWYFVVGKYDPATKKVSISLDAGAFTLGTTNLTRHPDINYGYGAGKVLIGGDTRHDFYSGSDMDEVGLYNSVLTQAQIDYLFALHRPRFKR